MRPRIRSRCLAPLTGLLGALLTAAAITAAPAWSQGTSATAIVPLTLESAVALALRESPLLASARADTARAQAEIRIQRASLQPSVAGETGIQYREPQFGTGGSGRFRQGFLVRGTVSYTLHDGGRTRLAVKAARLGASESELLEAVARDRVVAQVTVRYLGVLRAIRQAEIHASLVKAAREHLRTAQGLLDQKMAPETDVVRADAALRQALAEAQLAGAAIKTAEVGLKEALALGQALRLRLQPVPSARVKVGDLADYLHQAEQRRPELRAAAANIARKKTLLARAKRGKRPTVAGEGNVGRQGFGLRQTVAFVSVIARWPVLDGGLARARVEAARADLAKSRAGRQELRNQVLASVSYAYLDAVQAQVQITIRQSALTVARQSLRYAEARYENQLAPILEIVDAQAEVATADTALADAEFAVRLAWASLQRTVGSP